MRKTPAEISASLDRMMAERGIVPPRIYPDHKLARQFAAACTEPAVTIYPSPYVIERLAHAGADRLIANSAAYDAMFARTGAMLAEILAAGTGRASRRSKRAHPDLLPGKRTA